MAVGVMPVHAQATTAPHDTRLPNGMRVEQAINVANAEGSVGPARAGARPFLRAHLPGTRGFFAG